MAAAAAAVVVAGLAGSGAASAARWRGARWVYTAAAGPSPRNAGKRTPAAGASGAAEVHKKVGRWACIKQCGACCNLDPAERPDLDKYLRNPAELELYLSMVGDDGWCINFDKQSRTCRIYDDRPRFCRVEPDVWEDMFGVSEKELAAFACRSLLQVLHAHAALLDISSIVFSTHVGQHWIGQDEALNTRALGQLLKAMWHGSRSIPAPLLGACAIPGTMCTVKDSKRGWLVECHRFISFA
eukprot:jgi/Chlat1/2144/Chrsp17S02845